MPTTAVIDTNVFVSACLKADTAPRRVLRLCLNGEVQALMGAALYNEYLDVLGRRALFSACPLNEDERYQLFDAFISQCRWVSIYYLWRPNLADEGDNHLVELAVAGNASHIVTGNNKHFARSELRFADVTVTTCGAFLNRWSN